MAELEYQDMADVMSGDGSWSNLETTTTDDHGVLAYFSLGLKFICTAIILFMAGWIIITIMTTKSLHKNHNIYVANLMVADVISVLNATSLSAIMIISYSVGAKDFISCNAYVFLLFPVATIQLTLVVISVDKVIAVTFPLRYHQIMTPRVVFGIITAKWILGIVLYVYNLSNPTGFTKVAKFGICIANDSNLLVITTPLTVLTSLLTIILNIYLTIKAYQVHKQIQEESKLSGGHNRDNDQLKALEKKQATIKKHRKPMITLLVIVLGNSSIGLLLPILYAIAIFLVPSTMYEEILRYTITPNVAYFYLLLHPFVYGLYFKQVREPMMSLLKRITCPCKCKSAKVAPQLQRSRIVTWIHQY